MGCDSGLSAPQSLLDADYAYAVLGCGFVARAPREPYLRGQSEALAQIVGEHWRQAHPIEWERNQITARMSAD